LETYFIATRVTPLPDNPLVAKIEEAKVHFWIVEPAPDKAMERATRYLASYKWRLESVETEPVVVTAADFVDQEDGLKNWWKAKQKGFAARFMGKPKAGATI
jgi:anion-transporting  ArsA/GET3 family ATPase